ncbi:LysR family transcriptional regulator [Hydrogenophaga pseudoflava]|uniref:LysR family transcriptional regulator n=1 Tax=Hydrogenophaga pseudoflava TaxID=47421 RepID=UPI0027E3C2E7|nr:LysR family transcriptional regulator [Hydrogenophaga pseudoflava]MDQ7745763.1 LysR family transcriptional regulator [Hydrogenophaga pseudoflava]
MSQENVLQDPKLLRLLDAMVSTGSVTRAAEQLGLSQPTVSIGLGRLRTQLGDPLFVRTPQGMQPTPRTEALIGTVREVLDGLRRLSESEARFDPATARRSFRIYMTDASHITLLPRLFTHVRALAPGVQLEAAGIGPEMAHALQAGHADLALGLIPGLEAGFYQQALFDQDWVCLAHPHHPRLRTHRFSLRQYSQEAHVGIVSGTGQQLLEAAVKAQAVHRNVVLRLPGFLGLSAILSTTDLVATLPRHIGETLARVGGLRVLPCPVTIPGFTVKQHWHARYHHDEASRWLRGVCAELFLSAGRARVSPRRNAPRP